MNPEAQRIAIAEACGIKTEPCTCMGGEISRNAETKIHIPDYLNDLNAMHEAEKILSHEQFQDYIGQLYLIVLGNGVFSSIHATADQRAEAFLKTLGIWK